MWCTTATTTTTPTVPMRPPTCPDGPARAVAHKTWRTTATTTSFCVYLGRYPPKTATFVVCPFWQIASSVKYNMMPCANNGSKPWYRCECTNNTHGRLGDTGSMTFCPWFIQMTELPLQLSEVGSDRGHLLTQSCSDVSCVSISNRRSGLLLQ